MGFGADQGVVTVRGQACVVTSWSDAEVVCEHDTSAALSTNLVRVEGVSGEATAWWSLLEEHAIRDIDTDRSEEYDMVRVGYAWCSSTGREICSFEGDRLTIDGYHLGSDADKIGVTVGVSRGSATCRMGWRSWCLAFAFLCFRWSFAALAPRRQDLIWTLCACSVLFLPGWISSLRQSQGLSCTNVRVERTTDDVQSTVTCDLPVGGRGLAELVVSVLGIESSPYTLAYASDRAPEISSVICSDGECLVGEGSVVTVSIQVRGCGVERVAGRDMTIQCR